MVSMLALDCTSDSGDAFYVPWRFNETAAREPNPTVLDTCLLKCQMCASEDEVVWQAKACPVR
jgi:hypothetical protein